MQKIFNIKTEEKKSMSYDLTTLENGCQELGIQLNGQQK